MIFYGDLAGVVIAHLSPLPLAGEVEAAQRLRVRAALSPNGLGEASDPRAAREIVAQLKPFAKIRSPGPTVPSAATLKINTPCVLLVMAPPGETVTSWLLLPTATATL